MAGLLQQGLIAYFTFAGSPGNGTKEYTINIIPDTFYKNPGQYSLNPVNGNSDSYIYTNFSFSMIDGRVRGLADKRSGTGGGDLIRLL